jgi:p-hydroxybenzoate 3-monooxygenase
MTNTRRTQVGIIGAGPAGLVLAALLRRAGIDAVVLENRSREYVEKRLRAGVLEHGTVELLRDLGVGARMDAQGLVHSGVKLRFEGRTHRIALSDLTGGRSITVYGQQEVVKDLIADRLAAGGSIDFEVSDVSVSGLSTNPVVRYTTAAGTPVELACDFIAGCDGFHGICRPSIPSSALTVYERVYPFAWLGILAQTAPSEDELIYAWSPRGFALHSMRSPSVTRLYLQCRPDESLDDWSDQRIWDELQARLATDDGWTLTPGPLLEKGVTPMRSYVVEPMAYGRLFLAGDAAHIVPPTGAKGLNLAVADVVVLADALVGYFGSGRTDLLDGYSETCLRRVWRVTHFSWWMTSMLHRFPDADPFDAKLQLSQLAYTVSSTAAATTLAENYVGLPLPVFTAAG